MGSVLVVDDIAGNCRLLEAVLGPDGPELRARVRSLLRIKHYTDDLASAEAVIISLALTIKARDATTDGHCQRLAKYASAFGEFEAKQQLWDDAVSTSRLGSKGFVKRLRYCSPATRRSEAPG